MSFQFVEEGKWTRDAENLKFKVCIVFCMDSFYRYSFLVVFLDFSLCVLLSFLYRVILVKQKRKS